MRRSARLYAFVLATFMIIAAMPVLGSAADGLSGKKIVAFGDSLTELPYDGNTYVTYLAQYLGKTYGTDVINKGKAGNTTDMARERFQNDVLALDPDIVIICFGMNDQAIGYFDGVTPTVMVSPEKYRENLEYFAKTLTDSGCDVVFVTPNPVLVGEEYFNPETLMYDMDFWVGEGARLDNYCNIMREVAIEYNCGLVDIHREFDLTDLKDYIEDGIHQNDEGRKLYAALVSNYLKAKYNGTNKAVMTVNCVDENSNILKTVEFTGAQGANVILATPEIEGYSAEDQDIVTTFVNNAVYTVKYSSVLTLAMKKAETVLYSDYCEFILSQLRDAYAEGGEAVKTNANIAEKTRIAETIESLLSLKGGFESVVSLGASYTSSGIVYHLGGNVNDTRYTDDGIRLTDGSKGNTEGGNVSGKNYYSAWGGNSAVEIVVDLGKSAEVNTFNAYVAGSASWSISGPGVMEISVAGSDKSFDYVGNMAYVSENYGDWDTYKASLVLNSSVKAQYIKFVFTPSGNGFTWLDEVEVCLAYSPVEDGIGVKEIYSGGTSELSGNSVIASPDKNGNYIVTSVNRTGEVSLSDSEIALVCGSFGADISVGQHLELYGIDAENGELSIAPYIKVSDNSEEIIYGDVNGDKKVNISDCILIKRSILKTYILDGVEYIKANINEDKTVNISDYILCKRIILKTYSK